MRVRWRYIGMVIGLATAFMLPAPEYYIGNDGAIQKFLFAAIGLLVGELAERSKRWLLDS